MEAALSNDPEFMDDFGPEDEPEPEAPRRRGPGRPPGSGKKKRRVGTVTTTTRQELLDDGDEPRTVSQEFGGLFDERKSDESIARVRVIRRDPDEGILGYVDDPAANIESLISDQWGGGTFRLEAVNISGTYLGAKTIKIGKDPIFQTTAAEQQWRRARGLPPMGAAPAGAASHGIDIKDLLALTQAADERRRAEEREHQIHLRKMELDAEEKKRKDDEDRQRARAREDEERAIRLRKDEDEREARRRRDNAEAEQRQQQFMQQTIQMIQASNQQALAFAKAEVGEKKDGNTTIVEALKVIATIKDTFAGEGGGGDGEKEDVMQTLIKNLPAMLNGAGNAIGGAIREIKQGGNTPGVGQPVASGGLLSALPAGSPLASKVETLAGKIMARGQDPEVVLGHVVDQLLVAADGGKPNIPVQPAAPAPAQTKSGFAPGFMESDRPVQPASGKPGYVSTAKRITFKKA